MSGLAIDRVHLQRRMREGARVAGWVAIAVVKSTAHFLSAGVVIAGGCAAAYHSFHDVRQPDAVLLNRAIEHARDMAAYAAFAAAHPSAVAARDSALGYLAGSILLGVGGVWWLVEWWRSLPSIRKAGK
jgi:hypothetical protein